MKFNSTKSTLNIDFIHTTEPDKESPIIRSNLAFESPQNTYLISPDLGSYSSLFSLRHYFFDTYPTSILIFYNEDNNQLHPFMLTELYIGWWFNCWWLFSRITITSFKTDIYEFHFLSKPHSVAIQWTCGLFFMSAPYVCKTWIIPILSLVFFLLFLTIL
jgi:hypothetical protein